MNLDKAVEAAAKQAYVNNDRVDLDDDIKQRYRELVRPLVEAAYPFIADAHEAMRSNEDYEAGRAHVLADLSIGERPEDAEWAVADIAAQALRDAAERVELLSGTPSGAQPSRSEIAAYLRDRADAIEGDA